MVILITGITSGFGKAMAQRLTADGHKVYGTHRKAADFISGVTYIQADSQSDADCEAAVQQVMAAEGRIDVFINNAGMGIGGPIEFNQISETQRQMDVNWMGMVRYLHFVLPIMRKQHSGRIICLSSIGGLMGLPFQGAYSASKYAIEGYCEALRLETRNAGIKVIVVEPGDFATSFTAQRASVTDPEAQAAYPSYSKALSNIEHDETNGLKPEFLAAKICKIVKAKRPRHNYIVATFVQRLSVYIKAILPPKLFAKVLSLYYGL